MVCEATVQYCKCVCCGSSSTWCCRRTAAGAARRWWPRWRVARRPRRRRLHAFVLLYVDGGAGNRAQPQPRATAGNQRWQATASPRPRGASHACDNEKCIPRCYDFDLVFIARLHHTRQKKEANEAVAWEPIARDRVVPQNRRFRYCVSKSFK